MRGRCDSRHFIIFNEKISILFLSIISMRFLLSGAGWVSLNFHFFFWFRRCSFVFSSFVATDRRGIIEIVIFFLFLVKKKQQQKGPAMKMGNQKISKKKNKKKKNLEISTQRKRGSSLGVFFCLFWFFFFFV